MGPPQDHSRHFRVLAKGPLAVKDYRSFPRSLADMMSARKVISLMTPDNACYQVPADIADNGITDNTVEVLGPRVESLGFRV